MRVLRSSSSPLFVLTLSSLLAACSGGADSQMSGGLNTLGEEGGETSDSSSSTQTGSSSSDATDSSDSNDTNDSGTSGGDGDDDVEFDFDNNLFASPSPPGNLDPQNTPQIIVFGWDDCIFTGDHWSDTSQAPDNGMNFIAQAFGDITNPDGSPGHVSFYENGAYLPNGEVGGPWGSETDLTLAAGQELLGLGFELGSHTFDHLEINGTWGQIPNQWATGSLGGWADKAGTQLDKATWLSPVLSFNDTFLESSYGLSELRGFRAPRLEINDQGLLALAEYGYDYEVNMEEGQQWEYITAAVQPGQDAQGFNWVVWPHTLDNGSPGAWQSQDFGEKAYLKAFPTDLWEAPVYMLYIPDNGLQETIANRMKAEITSESTDWIGDKVREITAFDFNTFLFARMTKDEWVEVMKYNFLLRYNGNRAPLTFGAHPAEFSWRYDNEVVLMQPGNEDFHDVLNYNTYQDRKDAVYEFLAWVQANYGDEVWFMSNGELIDYMEEPFDLQGNPVGGDTLAEPANETVFEQLSSWNTDVDALGSDIDYQVVDANTLQIDFSLAANNESAGQYAYASLSSYFEAGAMANVSHIDVVYEADAPFRIRLLPEDSSQIAMQALLAGYGGDRTARIRIKDFRPDPYADPAKIASAELVDASYMSGVVGLSFESAATEGAGDYSVRIKRIVIHGLASARQVDPPANRQLPGRVKARPKAGSSAFWPRHAESHDMGHH